MKYNYVYLPDVHTNPLLQEPPGQQALKYIPQLPKIQKNPEA